MRQTRVRGEDGKYAKNHETGFFNRRAEVSYNLEYDLLWKRIIC